MTELEELEAKFAGAKAGTVEELIDFCKNQQTLLDARRIGYLQQRELFIESAKQKMNVDDNEPA
ncbi:MAG: hypothetical protein ACPG5P_03070 [Saprospiraceae bacterium]